MEGKNLILLIKALLNNKTYELDNPDFKSIYTTSKFHSLENMLYYAVLKYEKDSNVKIDDSIKEKLIKANKIKLSKSATQEAELEILKSEFNKNKIKFMPLKGCIIRYLYPSIDMRSMSDLDIYFDDTKHKEVKDILLNLGYDLVAYGKSNHDVYQKKPFMDIEMHRDLIHDIYKYHNYYKNFFDRLVNVNEYEYAFSKEDYYIYMVCHSAKHMMISGTGLRNVIDEYIYLRKYRDVLDFNYISKELEKLEISKYEENLRNLSYYLFSDEELNFDSEYTTFLDQMVAYITDSGTYGTLSNLVVNSFLGDDTKENISQSKIKYILRRIFPSYKHMKSRYKVLVKWPILLPLFYIVRFVSAIFKHKTKNELHVTKNIDKKTIEEYKKMKDKMGA